jgi:hypothetical protein
MGPLSLSPGSKVYSINSLRHHSLHIQARDITKRQESKHELSGEKNPQFQICLDSSLSKSRLKSEVAVFSEMTSLVAILDELVLSCLPDGLGQKFMRVLTRYYRVLVC